MEKEKKKFFKKKWVMILVIILTINVAISIGVGIFTDINLNRREVETSTQPENAQSTNISNTNNTSNENITENNTIAKNRKSILGTDLETIKTEFNKNSDDISKREQENYSAINNFYLDTSATGYIADITSTISLSTVKGFNLFLLVFSQIDYGYGGDSDKTVKAYEEILLKSCFSEITDNDISNIRKELGISDNLKDVVYKGGDTVKTKYYKGYKIIRNFVADTKSNKIAYTFMIQKDN